MSFSKLTTHAFLVDVTASTNSAWYPVDYRFPGDSIRSISGTKTSAADTVILELRTLVAPIGAGNVPVTAADVIATATTWTTAVTNFSAVVQGQFTHIRIRKTGSNAGVTVVGVV